jgi:hypothetical protein
MFVALISKFTTTRCPWMAIGDSRKWSMLFIVVFFTIFQLNPIGSWVLAVQQEDAVERVKEILDANASSSWYDSTADDYHIPKDFKKRDPEGRMSSWRGSISPTGISNNGGNNAFWSALAAWFLSAIPYLLGLILLLVGILLALWFLKPEMFSRAAKKADFRSRSIDLERIIDLPFSVESEKFDPLKEIEKCMSAGEFERATIYLFAYQLLQLDANQKIVLQRGKTNRTYLRELRKHSEIKSIVEPTMVAFEDVFFGRYRMTKETFLENWKRLEQFHQLLNEHGTDLPAAPIVGASA